MTKPIAPDYGTIYLLPPAVEDWVPENHPARFVREFVDALDLGELGFSMPQSSEGRPPYAPSLLLKIWLYGYLHKIRSTRRLEVACSNDLPLLWLCGLIRPDHNSLWRFWRDNKEALRKLFKQSVQVAVRGGLVGLCLQAIDGTKIPTVASGRTGWTKEQLVKLQRELDKALDRSEEEIQKAGAVQSQQSYQLPEKLEERKKLQEMVQKGLAELQDSGCNSYHRHEPQAKRMKNSNGCKAFSYNAQTVVDNQERIITAADVTNSGADQGQLVPMLKQAQENTGRKATTNVGDTGYGKGEDLQEAQKEGFEMVSPVWEGSKKSKDSPYHAHHFKYDPKTQKVRCPEDQELDYVSSGKSKGRDVKNYRCRIKDCPVRDQCTKDPKGRAIEIWKYHEVVQAQRKKLEQPAAQQAMSKRGEIVELPFAWIKEHFEFRRWTFPGLEGARTQWAMICLTLNLRAIYKRWKEGKLQWSKVIC